MDLGIRGQRAAEGCSPALTARRADVLGELAADLRARHGVEVSVLPADFSDPAAPAALAARALEAMGGVDILVLNAGGPPPGGGPSRPPQPVDELAYSNAGRSALVAWLKTTSRAVAADGVTVNGAHPGRHATARIEQLDRGPAEGSGPHRGGG